MSDGSEALIIKPDGSKEHPFTSKEEAGEEGYGDKFCLCSHCNVTQKCTQYNDFYVMPGRPGLTCETCLIIVSSPRNPAQVVVEVSDCPGDKPAQLKLDQLIDSLAILQDPNGRLVSYDTLVQVITNVVGATPATKQHMIAVLDAVKDPKELVDYRKMTAAIEALHAKLSDKYGMLAISHAVTNLDNVPIVEQTDLNDLISPEIQAHILTLLSLGQDVNGYYVSFNTFSEVVKGITDVDEATKQWVLNELAVLVTPNGLIDSLKLGLAMAMLAQESDDIRGIKAIIDATINTKNVPFVKIDGQTIN